MFIVLLFSMFNIVIQTTDPCQDGNHKVMNDVEWRNSAAANTLAHCDRRLDRGWYRIDSKAGSDMPTFCPQMNRCGTVFPVWLNGKGHYSISSSKTHGCVVQVLSQ